MKLARKKSDTTLDEKGHHSLGIRERFEDAEYKFLRRLRLVSYQSDY